MTENSLLFYKENVNNINRIDSAIIIMNNNGMQLSVDIFTFKVKKEKK